MSRVAKNPVALPAGVEFKNDAGVISIKGPLGTLMQRAVPAVKVELEDGAVVCRAVEGVANANALSGTYRALVNNMVTGVSKGFERKLTLVGVGYRAQAQGDKLNLTLGFSHPVVHQMPAGVKVETPLRPRLLSRVPTSNRSARSLQKCAPTGNPSLTRARASVIRTRLWCSRKPRRSKGWHS